MLRHGSPPILFGGLVFFALTRASLFCNFPEV